MLPRTLSGEARELLVSYDWRRNNVRELRNTIERMVVTADGETIRAEHVSPGSRGNAPAEPFGKGIEAIAAPNDLPR